MHLVQQLFLDESDNVALRIRLEIDKPNDEPEPAHVASLKVISLIGRTHTRAVPEYIVTNTANTIDIGLEPMQLAVNKRDSQMGKANLQIIYEDEKGTGVPLRIRRIVVSTEKALALPTTDSSVTLCSLNMVGVDWECMRADQGGLPKAIKDQAEIQAPILKEGLSDSNDKAGYCCYGNKGNDIYLDIPFTVESETLSFLQLCTRKFLISIEMKGEGDGVVSLSVNGKLQVFDGNRSEAKITSESQELTLELDYKQLSRHNILQVAATQNCEFICLGQVKLEIA